MAKFSDWSEPSQSYKEDEVDRELYEKFPLQFSIIHQFLKELVAKKQREENHWWKDFHRFCTSTCLYFGKDEQQGKLAVDGFFKILKSSKARGNYNLIDDQEWLIGFHHFRSLRRGKDLHDVMSDPIEKEWLHDFHQFDTLLFYERDMASICSIEKEWLPEFHVKSYIPTFTSSEVERKMEQPSAKEWLEDLDQFCTLFEEKDYTEVVIGEQEKRQWLDEFHQLLALFPENGDDCEVDWNQMEQLARAGPIFGNMQPAISGLLDDIYAYFATEKSIRNCYCRIDNVNDANIALSPSTLHASLVFSNSVSNPKKVLDTFLQRNSPNHLQTLLLLGEHKHLIHQAPRELFGKLGRHLNVLDLSRTSITELPSSFANLRSLRYLDVSGTPITRLPNCICSFQDMQTLRLKDCFQLLCLPKHLSRLTKLRHLDMDMASQLTSMPPGMGSLTELRTLPVFIVGKTGQCNIYELSRMSKLQGTLSILRLENAVSSAVVKLLIEKKHIDKLELEWSGSSYKALDVLETLRPHESIKELRIVGYEGPEFPSWLGDPTFLNLTAVKISNCRSKHVPSLGKLPQLQILHMSDFHEVKIISYDLEAGVEFPRLRSLALHRFPDLVGWTRAKDDDFPMLTDLKVSSCPNLSSFPQLGLLSSLKDMEISLCPRLKNIPTPEARPPLQSLRIINCPLLKAQFCTEAMISYLSYIPDLVIME